MEILGYKCFNMNMTNNYNIKFEVGQKYIALGEVKYGTNGNGFHMCKRLEDTLRYFDYQNNDLSICLVKGSGKIIESSDEYYGYYDMYSVEILEIIKKLSRQEIIEYALNLNAISVKRFITCFRLTKEEIKLFKEKYKHSKSVIDYIEYYQENKIDTFEKN